MPILGDLNGAAPIEGFASCKPTLVKAQTRTLGEPGSFPPGLLSGGGGNNSFAAARIDRLTRDFIAQNRSADADLFGNNLRMRARARELAVNNPYVHKYSAMVAQNVVGPAGILMQAKVRSDKGKETADMKRINQRIEQEWKRWGKRGRCTADGRFSWVGLQILAIKNAAREGEDIQKFVYGRQFNDTGFACQPLDNDQLDDSMMQQLPDGGSIRMGVEIDQYNRPQAYHLFSGHPFDITGGGRRERKRVLARYVNHAAMWERPAQTRGYTWLSACVLSLNQYSRYSEAVVVAARASAAKFFAIEQENADGLYAGDNDDDADDASADLHRSYSAESGEGFALDPGQKLNFIDPRFPTANHKQFMQSMVREFATALLVDYPTLANDLEGVNFSSIRAGMLDTRDCYRIIQRWFIEAFCEPIFQQWLEMALLTVLKDIKLTPNQMEMIEWKPRGWDWVDPLKDAQAIILKLQNGLTTYANALASLGLDFEETMSERAKEQSFLEALGITLGTDIRGQADTASDDSMNDPDEQDGKQSPAKKPAAKPAAGRGLRFAAVDRETLRVARELWQELQSHAPEYVPVEQEVG